MRRVRKYVCERNFEVQIKKVLVHLKNFDKIYV